MSTTGTRGLNGARLPRVSAVGGNQNSEEASLAATVLVLCSVGVTKMRKQVLALHTLSR